MTNQVLKIIIRRIFNDKKSTNLSLFSGLANASIPTPEPVKQRKMFGAYGKAVGPQSYVFVNKVRL